jgi:phosphoserine aminotransferase
VHIAWNGESEGFSRMPQASELDIPSNSAYVHITSNETIEGVALTQDLDTGDVPVFCDASSDFLSRPLDINKYALIYAGLHRGDPA